jgi:phosphatidylserine/phosphatidylglycerophosphate/cardiolipin synthase-like enzyme
LKPLYLVGKRLQQVRSGLCYWVWWPGQAIVGSSNFTLSGITSNTEMNVVVTGAENHAQLKAWFEELWAEAEDFD